MILAKIGSVFAAAGRRNSQDREVILHHLMSLLTGERDSSREKGFLPAEIMWQRELCSIVYCQGAGVFLCELLLFLFPLSLVLLLLLLLFSKLFLFQLYPLCLQLEGAEGTVHALSRSTELENTIPKTTLTGTQSGAQSVEIKDVPRMGWKQI